MQRCCGEMCVFCDCFERSELFSCFKISREELIRSVKNTPMIEGYKDVNLYQISDTLDLDEILPYFPYAKTLDLEGKVFFYFSFVQIITSLHHLEFNNNWSNVVK